MKYVYILEVGFTRWAARRFEEQVNSLLARGGGFPDDFPAPLAVPCGLLGLRTHYQALLVMPEGWKP